MGRGDPHRYCHLKLLIGAHSFALLLCPGRPGPNIVDMVPGERIVVRGHEHIEIRYDKIVLKLISEAFG
jgi:hypothetical protein